MTVCNFSNDREISSYFPFITIPTIIPSCLYIPDSKMIWIALDLDKKKKKIRIECFENEIEISGVLKKDEPFFGFCYRHETFVHSIYSLQYMHVYL